MALGQKILGKWLFRLLMKRTFYGHFVGGESEVAIKPTVERLKSFGVKSILDYSAEEDLRFYYYYYWFFRFLLTLLLFW